MAEFFVDPFRQEILDFPEVHMAVHRITVELRGGSVVTGVLVDWGGEIIRVEGYENVPFAVGDVVAVRDASDAR